MQFSFGLHSTPALIASRSFCMCVSLSVFLPLSPTPASSVSHVRHNSWKKCTWLHRVCKISQMKYLNYCINTIIEHSLVVVEMKLIFVWWCSSLSSVRHVSFLFHSGCNQFVFMLFLFFFWFLFRWFASFQCCFSLSLCCCYANMYEAFCAQSEPRNKNSIATIRSFENGWTNQMKRPKNEEMRFFSDK